MTNDNFLGIPIHGDIVRSADRADQRPFEELQEELKKLLEFDSFTALRWRQYTPYFNDGDPCVFSIYGVGLKVSDDAVEGSDEIGDYEDGYQDVPRTHKSSYLSPELNEHLRKTVGLRPGRRYDHEKKQWVAMSDDWIETPDHPEMVLQAGKVASMIQNGSYYDGLIKAFGDHAVVTLSHDKIDVEFYEHD